MVLFLILGFVAEPEPFPAVGDKSPAPDDAGGLVDVIAGEHSESQKAKWDSWELSMKVGMEGIYIFIKRKKEKGRKKKGTEKQ